MSLNATSANLPANTITLLTTEDQLLKVDAYPAVANTSVILAESLIKSEPEELHTSAPSNVVFVKLLESDIPTQPRAKPGWSERVKTITSLLYELKKGYVCISCNKSLKYEKSLRRHVRQHFVFLACACGFVYRDSSGAARHWNRCLTGRRNGYLYEFDRESADALRIELGTELILPKPWPTLQEKTLRRLLDERKSSKEASARNKPKKSIKTYPELRVDLSRCKVETKTTVPLWPEVNAVAEPKPTPAASETVHLPPTSDMKSSVIDSHVREYSLEELEAAEYILQAENDRLSKCLEQNQVSLAVLRAKLVLVRSHPDRLPTMWHPSTYPSDDSSDSDSDTDSGIKN